jgi:polyisoprenoid-binding protein YceI
MRRLMTLLAVVIVLVAAAVVVFTQVWGGDAPEAVSLGTDAPVAGGDVEFEGTWVVDNDSGTFDPDNDEFTSTYAGYRIDEQLASIGANEAVGRTREVSGEMTISGNSISAVDVEVDMTTLESDQDRRDNAIRDRGLETDRFPTATFKLTKPIQIADEPAIGEKVASEASGDFTLHGVTKPISIPIEARWAGDRITVIASFDVLLGDYDIDAPTIPGRVLSVEDKGTVELQLHFTKA